MATVSENALIKRINRKLAKEGEKLHKSGNIRCQSNLGDYYVTDDRNTVIDWHCHLEDMGRELGVLHQNEHLAAA